MFSKAACPPRRSRYRKEHMKKNEGECNFEGCFRNKHSKGLCTTHYQQQRVGKPLTPIGKRGPKPGSKIRTKPKEEDRRRFNGGLNKKFAGQDCKHEGCTRPATVRYMCYTHDCQFRKYGYTWKIGTKRPRKDGNDLNEVKITDGFSTDRYCEVCNQTKHWTKYHLEQQMCADCHRIKVTVRLEPVEKKPLKTKKKYTVDDLLADIATLSEDNQ